MHNRGVAEKWCSYGRMPDFPIRTAAELRAEGLTFTMTRRRVRDGELLRVRHGAYTDGGGHQLSAWEQHARLTRATVGILHPGSVVSHASAAVHWGLSTFPLDLSRVTVTRPDASARASRWVHSYRAPLSFDDVCVVDGVAFTTLARTVIDLARLHAFEWGVAWCDQALRLGCDPDELAEVVAGSRRRPGNARAQRAVAFADERAESPLESISRVQIWRLGFPAPELQYEVREGGTPTGRFVARCDFAWLGGRLVAEADGRTKYEPASIREGDTPTDVIVREKARQEAIRRQGWWFVRWGFADAMNPERLRRILDDGFRLTPRAG